MPFKIMVKDVQDDIAIKKICGVRTDSRDFFALINEVEQSLMHRGGWFDLEQRIQFCIAGCHIVWPEFVGTVLAIRFCHGNVAVSRNGWYSFAPNQSMNNGRHGFGNGFGEGFRVGSNWDNAGFGGGDVVVEDANSRPCYNDVSCTTGSQLRYYVVNPNDVGKTITIFGKKFGGQPLQERSPTGAIVNGTTITAANPFGQGFDLVASGGIESIIREETESMAYLYEYDALTGLLRDIGAYQPGETHPRYRCSRILNVPRRTIGPNECCFTPIEAKIKLKFVELKNERDFIPVDNLRALKLGIQAVKLEEKNEDGAAAEKWALAVHELNLESFDKSPDEQIVFQNNTFGDRARTHRRIW